MEHAPFEQHASHPIRVCELLCVSIGNQCVIERPDGRAELNWAYGRTDQQLRDLCAAIGCYLDQKTTREFNRRSSRVLAEDPLLCHCGAVMAVRQDTTPAAICTACGAERRPDEEDE